MDTFPENSKPCDVHKSTILIVDNDSTNRAMVSEFLKTADFTILLAEDAETALEKAQQARPDLILLDISMPEMDGVEICRRLKTTEGINDIPVILMLNLADTEQKARGLEAGAADCITKPFQQPELLARAGAHLRIRKLTGKLRDTTESLKNQVDERTMKLMTSERQLTDIINFLPDAIFAVDLEGRITLWNHTAEQYTGVKRQDMLGKGNHEYALPFYGTRRPMLIDLVLTPTLKIDRMFSSVQRTKGAVTGESCVRSAKRSEAYVLSIAAPLFDSRGRMVGAIESIRDITKRKRAEEELRFSNTIL